MKWRLYLIAICALLFVSCSSRRGRFRMEGHFLHMNQGRLLVYSNDGIINGIDTINISGGRFSYEIPCNEPGTLMIVFPNFSEQPVFAESGGSVDLSADVSHLKEMEITGTEENELMTDFRKQTAQMSPPDVSHHAELFIGDHPESAVSEYLLRRYFILAPKPEYGKANTLLDKMIAEQKDNGRLLRLKNDVKRLKEWGIGAKMPSFSVTASGGGTINSNELKGQVTVIMTCATWQYESINQMRMLKQKMKEKGKALKVVGICLDANTDGIKKELANDSVSLRIACDGMMFEGKLVEQLGLYKVPGNVVYNKQGHVVERNLETQELLKKIDDMLK